MALIKRAYSQNDLLDIKWGGGLHRHLDREDLNDLLFDGNVERLVGKKGKKSPSPWVTQIGFFA